MPRYFYTAKSFDGKTIRDERKAEDERELAKILREEGFILISAQAEEAKGFKKSNFFKKQLSLPFLGGVGLKDKIIFIRSLKVMLSAGVSLPNALNTLSVQTKNQKLKTALLEVRKEVLGGKKLSDGLRKFPRIFGDFYYHMVRIGEESGTLEQSLDSLTSQTEKEYELRSNIQGALMYPAVIIMAMLGIAVLMLIVVIPKITKTFYELKIELPLTTRVITGTAVFLSERWYILILLVIILFLMIFWMMKNKTGKTIKDWLLFKIPIISSLVKKSSSAYVIRSLATLLEVGVPILQSLEVIQGATGNHYFKKSLGKAIVSVEKGGKISQSLESYSDFYTPMVIQMIKVGEETGQTSEILKKTADFLEEEVSRTTKNLAQTIEPVLILLIGGAVGFFAISVIQPIYQMMGSLK